MITNYLKNKYDKKDTQESISALIIVGIIIGAIVTFASMASDAGEIAAIVVSILIGFIICMVLSTDTDLSVSFSVGASVTLLSSIFIIIAYDITTWVSYPLWTVLAALIIVTEILFLLDKTSPNTIEVDKKGLMWFTTKRKIEALIEAIILLTCLKTIYKISSIIDFVKIYSATSQYFVYALEILAVIAVIYVYIWINSLRYGKIK